MDEFLKLEYEKCLDLVKYYDEKNLSLMKFATGGASSIVSLVFAFYQLGGMTREYFWQFTAVLAWVVDAGLLAIFLAMVQNRLYFIYPARQVNAIRRAMFARPQAAIVDNQMYLTTDVPAFKLTSLQTLLNLLVAGQVGALAGLVWFSIGFDPKCLTQSILNSIAAATLVTLGLFVASSVYLARASRHRADASVHGQHHARAHETKS